MLSEQDFYNLIDEMFGNNIKHHAKTMIAKRCKVTHDAACEMAEKRELSRFFDWFQRNQFKVMKRNPKFVPGEGYSGAPHHEWSVTEILQKFQDFKDSLKMSLVVWFWMVV